MRHIIPHCAALLLVGGLYGAIALPAHADGGCDPGETFLGSKERQAGNRIFRDTYCAKTAGSWSRNELDRVFGVLNTLPDTPAKEWTNKNVAFVRDSEKGKPPVCWINSKGEKKCLSNKVPSPYVGRVDDKGRKTTSPNGHVALFFNDDFFSESSAVQRSLFAFESGKALFIKSDLESWFAINLNGYSSAMDEMVAAGKAPNEPNIDLIDPPSQFGGLFRAAMLQLTTRPGWREPLSKLDKLLRSDNPAGSP